MGRYKSGGAKRGKSKQDKEGGVYESPQARKSRGGQRGRPRSAKSRGAHIERAPPRKVSGPVLASLSHNIMESVPPSRGVLSGELARAQNKWRARSQPRE